MKKKLQAYLQELFHLQSVIRLAEWDQLTYMPAKGADARGKQLSLLERLYHQRLIAPELDEYLEEMAQDQTLSEIDQSMYRVLKRERDRAIRLPESFVTAFSEHKAYSYQQWLKAKEANDFSIVAPAMKDTLSYTKEYLQYFSRTEHIADPLIDEGDEGMTVSRVRKLFQELKDQLVPFVREITNRPQLEDAFLHLHYPREKQLEIISKILPDLGYDSQRMSQDFAAHPFMTKIAHDDVRITTRVNEYDLVDGLFSSIHELGHGLYELNFSPTFEGTPLHEGASFGVHESQSRLLENLVGRSLPFWERYYPALQEQFPSQLGNVSLKQFYQAINRVKPSLIRTEADEVTYNLHVMIRFELEMALLENDLTVDELPTAWNEAYQRNLGVYVSSDREGVMQDIHWYCDFLGGMFHGYTLGNLLSAQFYQAAVKSSPQILNQIQEGNFQPLIHWLTEHVHRHAHQFTPDQIVERATGTPIQVQPFLDYLQGKYVSLYAIN
ncbi:carboxypeptidase Taq [Seinonella peptonophila]|uniref:Metal-dependent carboxypeptidase n=1 Tax=Seinonella peptonophila TaxID=112248 RepID=A0A1M4Z5G6_9BACL|nr:carboxypeptidase M32 [Seinonella peptonophila]SHF12836.1 carboxypeptidase Taq [Seinonella peptonophila]